VELTRQPGGGLERRGDPEQADPGRRERRTGKEVYDKIWPAIRGVGNGKGTYGDLSLIAHYTKVAMTANPSSRTTGHELGPMMALVGGMHGTSEPIL